MLSQEIIAPQQNMMYGFSYSVFSFRFIPIQVDLSGSIFNPSILIHSMGERTIRRNNTCNISKFRCVYTTENAFRWLHEQVIPRLKLGESLHNDFAVHFYRELVPCGAF